MKQRLNLAALSSGFSAFELSSILALQVEIESEA